MRKKTPKTRKDTISKVKERIQALLKFIVRARDGDCIFKGMYRECSGPLSADHIVSRTHSRTYGLTDNVVCVCIGHHFFWKPSNPTLYTNRIDEYIGKKRRLYLEKIARPVCQYSLKDWLKIEDKLKTTLKMLTS
jgi:hypothetical protein